MSVKSLIAVAAACLAVAATANPAAATNVPFGVGPIFTGPGTQVWIGISNVGSTNVTLSNAFVYSSGQQVVLNKSSDNCTDHVQVPGAACSINAYLPQQNVAAWVTMQATSTTGLRGVFQVLDTTNKPITSIELK
jgi:O-glycosyl hydrolase